MKTKHLIVLIKGLTSSEKARFTALAKKKQGEKEGESPQKKYSETSKKQPGETAYLLLFKELERWANEWDPEQGDPSVHDADVERFLRKKKINTSLSNLRVYLADALFQSLLILNKRKSKQEQIDLKVQAALLLENRGLMALAGEELKEALDLALRYQYYGSTFHILTNLLRIESQIDSKSYVESHQRYLMQLYEVVGFMEAEAQHSIQYFQEFLSMRHGKAMAAFSLSASLSATSPTPSFFSKAYAKQTLCLAAHRREDYEESWKQSRQLIDLWISHKEMKEEYLDQYIRHTFNHFNFSVKAGKYEEGQRMLDELECLQQLKNHSYNTKAELVQNILFAKQLFYMNTDRLEEAIDLYPDIEKAVITHKRKINNSRKMAFKYNQMIGLFALEKWDEAIDYCIEVIRAESYEHRRDLQQICKIMQIIFRFEQGTYKHLGSLIPNSSGLEKGRDLERIILNNLSKLVQLGPNKQEQAKNASNITDRFHQFHQELSEYRSNPSAPPPPFRLDELLLWTESKVRNVAFRILLRRKNGLP